MPNLVLLSLVTSVDQCKFFAIILSETPPKIWKSYQHIVFHFRDLCEEAGWLFETDDEGYKVVIVPLSGPDSDWCDSNEGDDDEVAGNS